MSEEEKEAIEMLEKFIIEHKLYNIKQSDNLELNIKKVLNLIEKQQKEIEELEDFIKHAQIIVPFENTNIKENEPLADIVEVEHKEYISKDKIKELIENNEEDIDYSVHDIIKDLKELLGEERGEKDE